MRASKGFGVGRYLVLAAAAGLTLYVVLFYHELVAGVVDNEICKTCHENTYNEATSNLFRHSVVQDKCGVCHVGDRRNAGGGGGAVSFASSGLHRGILFPLKGFSPDKNDLSVEVTAINASGKRSRPVVAVFDGNTAPELADVASALSISDVRVEEVKQGVFFEAVISWKTDSFADSALEYRASGERFKPAYASTNYSKEHRATLGPLKPGAEYYFRISARDLYGNTVRSGEGNFSTAAPFNLGVPVKPLRRLPRVEEVKFLKTRNGDFYLLASADSPSSFTVTVRESVKETLGRPTPLRGTHSESGSGTPHGSGLLAPRASAIEACVSCHPQGSSHPVGISAKTKDTVIPPNLPTLSGGVIACITCHLPHGGERKYFARMDFERDLCVECHRKDPFI